jgi:FtsZ-interacting cell division protein ZipA
MPELRWTLLILGALFIGGLALWELRRQRHARGEQISPRDGERVQPTFDDSDPVREQSSQLGRGDIKTFREPTLTFPEVTDRAPVANPRVMDVDDPSLAGLRVDADTAVDEFSSGMPEMSAHAAPMVPELSPPDDLPSRPATEGFPSVADDAPSRPAIEACAEGFRSVPAPDADDADDAPLSQVDAGPVSDPLDDAEPIVDWPDEAVRKIIAVRLVSSPGERFQGRTVRLALTAEGFRLGKFEIFHKPGPDSRAVLSAASLTKPGTFALATMDAQRFGGLSLFAVLPGPLSPVATFDELLLTARSLNNRLRGALQDERGEPLTPVRSAALREGLTAAATAAAPVVGPPD